MRPCCAPYSVPPLPASHTPSAPLPLPLLLPVGLLLSPFALLPAAELFSFCRRSPFAASIAHTHTHTQYTHPAHTHPAHTHTHITRAHTHTFKESTHNSAAGEVCPNMPAAWYNFYFSLLRLLSLLLWLPLALFLFCSSYFCLFLLWCGPTALARGQATLEAHQILNSLRLWHTIFGLELGHGQRLGLGLGMCMMWERQRQPHTQRERERWGGRDENQLSPRRIWPKRTRES